MATVGWCPLRSGTAAPSCRLPVRQATAAFAKPFRTVDRVRQGLYWTAAWRRGGSLCVCPPGRYARVAKLPARRQYPGRCCLQMMSEKLRFRLPHRAGGVATRGPLGECHNHVFDLRHCRPGHPRDQRNPAVGDHAGRRTPSTIWASTASTFSTSSSLSTRSSASRSRWRRGPRRSTPATPRSRTISSSRTWRRGSTNSSPRNRPERPAG